MMELWPDTPNGAEAISPASAIPRGTLSLGGRLQQSIDRRLGYFGQDRFVLFYYEARGEEVVFNDGHTYGFGSGGWQAFADEVAPLARRYGLNLGTGGTRADHVLLVDRGLRQTYLAVRDGAEQFVARQHAKTPAEHSAAAVT